LVHVAVLRTAIGHPAALLFLAVCILRPLTAGIITVGMYSLFADLLTGLLAGLVNDIGGKFHSGEFSPVKPERAAIITAVDLDGSSKVVK